MASVPLALGLSLGLTPSPSFAAPAADGADPTASSNDRGRIAEQPDGSWISLSGTVVGAGPDAFRLDHGEGVITVEMDDFDAYPEGRHLFENDRVTVMGRLDKDLFERRSIEASSVYVKNLGTQFFANPIDEEEYVTWAVAPEIVPGRVEVSGEVSDVRGRAFTIESHGVEVVVDTASMPTNPMDDHGFLQLDEGDAVRVSGPIEVELFDGAQIEADSIIEYTGR